jgi:hypothetical protein
MTAKGHLSGLLSSLCATLLLVPLLLLGSPAPVAGQQALPACPQPRLFVRATGHALQPGKGTILKTVVINAGSAPVSGVGVRIDLPRGVTPKTTKETPELPYIVAGAGGTTAVYWTGLSLRAGSRRRLKVHVRACVTTTGAALGTSVTLPLKATIYLVNATNAVTCLAQINAPSVRFSHKRPALQSVPKHEVAQTLSRLTALPP